MIQPKARTTTAVTLEANTEILKLSHEAYTRIIEKAIKKDLYVRTTYLSQFRILKQLKQS